jgi:GT2 family glycosyltransferase
LLLRTLKSLEKSGTPEHKVSFALVDNGSDDDVSEAWWMEADLKPFVVASHEERDGRGMPGRGVNWAVAFALCDEPDLVCFSDDDMEWTPGWLAPVVRFFEFAPKDIVLLSGLLEPEWEWNAPREMVEAGGVRALVRDSLPGASWMFRASDWPKLGPVAEDRTHDIAGCARIRESGLRMAAMDLVDHIGTGHSTLGNTIAFGKPLDREKWGV